MEGLSKELKESFLGDSFSGEEKEEGAADGILALLVKGEGMEGEEGEEEEWEEEKGAEPGLNLNLSNFVKNDIISGWPRTDANLNNNNYKSIIKRMSIVHG